MPLPLAGIFAAVTSILPVLKRKGVKAGIATVAAGALGHATTGTGVLSDPQLVELVNALSNLCLAAGTVVAAWKGRKPRKRPRAASGAAPA